MNSKIKRLVVLLVLTTLATTLVGCGTSKDDDATSNEATSSQASQTFSSLSLEDDFTKQLEEKSYINLCSVSLEQSVEDEGEMTFAVVIIGDNLDSNLDDILSVFLPNIDKLDFNNSTIKDDTGLLLYPKIVLPEGNLSDWNLILLNHDAENKIEQDLSFEQVKFDTQYVDARAGIFYQQMCEDASKEGITLYLRSGYRNISTQTVNYNANIQRLQNQGLSYDEAVEQTNLYYTVPGHSEHHTGLAFDIITPEYHNDIYTLSDAFAQTEAYDWLIKNCADYGFILRYQEHKTDITQINFEPWHYRYVGIEHAKYIMENDICLEEYIKLLKQVGR